MTLALTKSFVVVVAVVACAGCCLNISRNKIIEKKKSTLCNRLADSLRSLHLVRLVRQFLLLFNNWIEENVSTLELKDLARVLLHFRCVFYVLLSKERKMSHE